jgi:ribosomal protein L44E
MCECTKERRYKRPTQPHDLHGTLNRPIVAGHYKALDVGELRLKSATCGNGTKSVLIRVDGVLCRLNVEPV